MSNYLQQLKTPTLILDEDKAKANIKMMAEKARQSKVKFRPHFKTHQSHAVGEWFREEGVDAITVSSVKMAQYFAANGWDDITVAFPFNIHEVTEADELAGQLTLNLLVESVETAKALGSKLKNKTGVYIKIDTGYHRAGIPSFEYNEIESVLDALEEIDQLNFKGFLSHCGHSYKAASKQEIEMIYNRNLAQMKTLKGRYISRFPDMELSTGDTPTCSVMQIFEGFDEIRPGVFVFYDVMQHYIGACSLNQVAVAMACPIVAKHESSNELIVYGGGIHFSKDFIETKEHGRLYGLPVELVEETWSAPLPGCKVKSLSQEHGIVVVTDAVMDKFQVGDFIGILPIHACMAVDAMKQMITTKGEQISCIP